MAWAADAFLQKRYQAGKEVGEVRGIARGEARKEAQVRKFLGEHPEATAADVLEFLSQSRRNGRNGDAA